jgi:hypothetical protein
MLTRKAERSDEASERCFRTGGDQKPGGDINSSRLDARREPPGYADDCTCGSTRTICRRHRHRSSRQLRHACLPAAGSAELDLLLCSPRLSDGHRDIFQPCEGSPSCVHGCLTWVAKPCSACRVRPILVAVCDDSSCWFVIDCTVDRRNTGDPFRA